MVMTPELKEIEENIERDSILVTAIGSFAADATIKSLKDYGLSVVGCDVYQKEWLAEACSVDSFYQAPYAVKQIEYINFIEEICSEKDIKYIIPLIDPEVDLLSREKKRFEKKGIKVCTSDYHTITLCRDKYKLPKFLKNNGVEKTIDTKLLGDVEKINLPSFIKPRTGRSSEGCRLINHVDEFNLMKKLLSGDDTVVQSYIEGHILTVDVIRDPLFDEIVCIGRRELIRTKTGAGISVEIIENKKLDKLCKLIVQKVGIIGAVNIEFIETKKGDIIFLEINPRFSGGVVFSHIAGYDVVINHLKCFMNKPIMKAVTLKKMYIARKYTEHVTKNINTKTKR